MHACSPSSTRLSASVSAVSQSLSLVSASARVSCSQRVRERAWYLTQSYLCTSRSTCARVAVSHSWAVMLSRAELLPTLQPLRLSASPFRPTYDPFWSGRSERIARSEMGASLTKPRRRAALIEGWFVSLAEQGGFCWVSCPGRAKRARRGGRRQARTFPLNAPDAVAAV